MNAHCIVISGCSGGGKSTLLAELARRGHRVFAEPGRDIVREELAAGGDALPWSNPQKFAERCIDRGIEHLAQARAEENRHAFFDRSIVDAVAALEHMGAPVPEAARATLAARPYARTVFMAPPWPELFTTDAERRHTFDDAAAEYERLLRAYRDRGHDIALLPKLAVQARADFLLRAL